MTIVEILFSGNLPEKINSTLILKTTVPHGFLGEAHDVGCHSSLRAI